MCIHFFIYMCIYTHTYMLYVYVCVCIYRDLDKYTCRCMRCSQVRHVCNKLPYSGLYIYPKCHGYMGSCDCMYICMYVCMFDV